MLRGSCRHAGILLSESLNGQQDSKQAAHHEISPNMFDRVHHCLLEICWSICRLRPILSDSSFIRVSVATQLTSQLLPPSSENACSKRHEFVVMFDITNRTRMARPIRGSWSKNSPRPFLNSPIMGWLTVPPLLLAKLRLHWWDSGLYRRRFRPSKSPAAPSASSSTRLQLPSHTFQPLAAPSSSTHA